MLVSGSLPPMRCGVGDYTDALARALAATPGNQVAVLTSRGGGKGSDAMSYEVLPDIESWSLRGVAAARHAIAAWEPNVVHLQYPTQGYDSAALPSLTPLLAWQAGAMPVRTWHEAFSGRNSVPFLLQSAAPGPYIVVRPGFADLMWPPLRILLRGRRRALIEGASAIPRSTLNAATREAVRRRYLGDRARLVVFFGFLHPAKGVDQLFDIADPARDALVIAGGMHAGADYAATIAARAAAAPWAGHASLPGFLPVSEVADLLAAADVILLPFVDGGGSWNSSISAALVQGTPVVTTARERHGPDETGQVYFSRPGDVADMRRALDLVARRKMPPDADRQAGDWTRIANEHMAVYQTALGAAGEMRP